MRVVIDTEFSGFQRTAILWCIVCRDIDTGIVYIFEHPELNPERFNAFARTVSLWIGHNLIGFDAPRLAALGLPLSGRCLDTLVVSRILNWNIVGGHSLEAWSERLAGVRGTIENFSLDTEAETWYNNTLRYNRKEFTKDTLREPLSFLSSTLKYFGSSLKGVPVELLKVAIPDFSVYTRDLLYRCVADTKINAALYRHFEKYLKLGAFDKAIEVEQAVAKLAMELESTGFALDVPEVRKLYAEVSARLSEVDSELLTAFPPKRVLQDVIRPRLTKDGSVYASDLRRLTAAGYTDCISELQEYEIWTEKPFNPGSHKQIIERLHDAGWKPTDKTKGHIEATSRTFGRKEKPSREKLAHFKVYGWTLSEDNLKTLPADAPPAAQRLVERLLLKSRQAVLEAWLTLVKDGRIHGKFLHIGSWTHRMAHQNPNMANVPKVVHPDKPSALDILSDEINGRMRKAWIAPPGRRLVGVDADGIQMRIFAHYVNDQRLIDALLKGRKEDKTDIHSLHKSALGAPCKSRDAAKRFIYAWLLGAGVAKVAEILECSNAEAKAAVDAFLEFYPGLAALKRDRIPADAGRGYFVGLDGRLVVQDDAHLILAGYLQNGEAVIMKRGLAWWHPELRRLGIDFKFVNFVHDEWQTEIPDDEEISQLVQRIQIESIVRQGTELALNCPLAGTGTDGYNWQDTH